MIPRPIIATILNIMLNILQHMSVEFSKYLYNRWWKLSENSYLRWLWTQVDLSFKMVAILGTILNILTFWTKPMFHFNRLYHKASKHP